MVPARSNVILRQRLCLPNQIHKLRPIAAGSLPNSAAAISATAARFDDTRCSLPRKIMPKLATAEANCRSGEAE